MFDATAILTSLLTSPWPWTFGLFVYYVDANLTLARDGERSALRWSDYGGIALMSFCYGVVIALGCAIVMSMPWQSMP